MSDLSDLGRESRSDKPGRRYFKANVPVKSSYVARENPPNPNYSKEDQEEISNTCNPGILCGTAIPISLTNIGRFTKKAKRERGELKGDSGMHIVDLENQPSGLEQDHL